jgi:chorismate dehydratase
LPERERLRLGRISYANMAPVFYDLSGADVEQVTGVPTDLNRRLIAGEIDVAPISSIEYARNASSLRLLPGLCVSADGAVDSIQLITPRPLEQVRSVAVTPESATSVVLTRVLLGDVDLVPLGEPADARMLIGDAALRSAFEDPTPHFDLGRLWQERTGLPMVFAVWAYRDGLTDGLEELERAHLRSLALARSEPELLARRAASEYGWPAGFLARYFEKLRYHFGPRERQGLQRFFELAHLAGELDEVPELRFADFAAVA